MTGPTFDDNGYPTDATLDVIAQWNPCDLVGLFAFIEAAWHDNGKFRRKRGARIELVTGGWSGNESLIRALERNQTAHSLCWQSSERGGVDRFAIPKNFRTKAAT